MINDDKIMVKIQAFVSKKHYEFLQYYSRIHKIPISRLIAYSIDEQCIISDPFNMKLEIPKSEYTEYAFANEAGKIITFLKTQRVGMSLDMLYIMRHDIGISNREAFLNGFRECLEKEMLEAYQAPKSSKYAQNFDVVLYRVKGTDRSTVEKLKKRESEREQYERLKKKYGNKRV